MELTPDELAGVVDILGPVTQAELRRACGELAFKRGVDAHDDAVEQAVEAALASYHLVAVPVESRGGDAAEGPESDTALVVPGPTAFPVLPDSAEDLPHILDVPERDLDRETAAQAAETQFRTDAADAVRAGDDERIQTLLDVSYELEAWGPVDLASARDHLDEASRAN